MTEPLGRRLLTAADPAEWLRAEGNAGARFATVDALAAEVVTMSFAGQLPVRVIRSNGGTAMTMQHLSESTRDSVADLFDFAAQQSRGAWWLPESAVVPAGVVNLPTYYGRDASWAMNAAANDSGRVAFADSPDGLACWALLVPLAEVLYAPLALRAATSGALPRDKRDAAWAAVESSYASLGLTGDAVAGAVATMRPGNGWSRMRSLEQKTAKLALIVGLRDAVTPETVSRWRAMALRRLVDRYYAKAKTAGPTARAVLTKALHPAVSAYFGGDWMALLDYLGEAPAPGEEITTALPEARLYVQASAKVTEVAAEKNMPVEAVAQILASYMGSDEVRSPVERRLDVLRTFWAAFDDAHARQAPGMPPLGGLVDEGWPDFGEREPFRTPAHQRLLPARLLADIDTLWGGTNLPRYPDRTVSALYPHHQLAVAFGPGLRFWHNLATTCWHYCEGPYARSDINGLAQHYGRDLAELAAAGTPVDPQLFTDLQAAQHRLGPPVQTWDEVRQVAPGMTVSSGGGTRRTGFAILRDVITIHRQVWAEDHLDRALRGSWEPPLRELARQVNRTVAGSGKLPTAKQVARLAEPLTNGWFGGDLAAVYAAVGEKAPAPQTRVELMPANRTAFCNALFTALGGRYVPNSRAVEDIAGNHLSWDFRRLAAESLRFLQLEEALDRPPTDREFGANRLTWPDELGFDRYAAVVTELRSTWPAGSLPTDGQPVPRASRAAVPVVPPTAGTRPPAPTVPRPPRPVSTEPAVAPLTPRPLPAAQPAAPTASVGAAERPGLLGRLFGHRQPPPPPAPAASAPPPGWHPDPHIPGQLRWWDGTAWTADVHSS